jgi:hypothetical protein
MSRDGLNMAKRSRIASHDAEIAQNMARDSTSISTVTPNMAEYGGNALSLVSLDVGLHGLAVARFGRASHNLPWDMVVAWYIPVADAISAMENRHASHIRPSGEPLKAGQRHKRGPEIWRALALAIPPEACADVLVVETMVVYEGSTVDPADLLELQGICGACCTALPWGSVVRVEARTWSEGVPKDVRHARLETSLTSRGWQDRLLSVPARRRNDVLDAVGMGLWWTGSTSTRRWSASLRP